MSKDQLRRRAEEAAAEASRAAHLRTAAQMKPNTDLDDQGAESAESGAAESGSAQSNTPVLGRGASQWEGLSSAEDEADDKDKTLGAGGSRRERNLKLSEEQKISNRAFRHATWSKLGTTAGEDTSPGTGGEYDDEYLLKY